MAVLQLSFQKTIVNLYFRVQTKSKQQLTILKFSQRGSFNRPHYYNWQGNSGENKARDPTKHRGQLHGVTSLGWLGKKRNALPINDSGTFVVAPNSGILKTLLNFELSGCGNQALNLQLRTPRMLRKSNAAQFNFRNWSVVILLNTTWQD